MLTRAHFNGMIGQRIVCRTTDGITHHGVLHSVTSDGIYLRPAGRTAVVSDSNSQGEQFDILPNLGGGSADIQEAWWPFFFLPFFALAWAYPWGWAW